MYTQTDKCNALSQHFVNSHNNFQHPINPTSASAVNQSIIKINASNNSNFNRFFTLEEVYATINTIKSKKAHGPDEIPNKIIKSLPKKAILTLTKIYNSCLRLSYFPKSWKIGKVIAIPKPKKLKSLPSSYRPISLLCSFSKIFEKLILARLTDFETEKNIIINQQFGFRPKHSTAHQILRLCEKITLNFNKNRTTGLLLIDLEKTFDTVWHQGLLHKLFKLHCPMYLIKIIQSFLTDRYSYVQIENAKSNQYPLPAGVPQGSVLSPALFNIFLNDIPKPKKCDIAIYADDTALIASTHNHNSAQLSTKLSNGFKRLNKYFEKWRISVNNQKKLLSKPRENALLGL